MEKNAEVSMMMILHAGDAMNLAMQALRAIKTSDYDQARKLLDEARQKSTLGHQIQTDLLHKMFEGNTLEMDLLLVHAQDHLMNSLLTIDLVEGLIDVFEARLG